MLCLPQMVSGATLAFLAASLVAVASAQSPSIDVVVGNFALNLVRTLLQTSLIASLLRVLGGQTTLKVFGRCLRIMKSLQIPHSSTCDE